MSKNITYAAFAGPGRKATATPSLYQWDYGQILKISGLELSDAYQVHFSNTPQIGSAKGAIGNTGGVQIPDEYLRTGQPVYAWLFLHAGEDDGETVFSITIPVQKRPEPTDETPTPVEQSEISQAIAALQEAARKAGTAQGDAEAAQAAAEAAQKSAEAAQETAEAAADAAEASEEAAGEKADEAEVQALLAKSYAVGNTGTRDGEDTDNAKYYKEQAAQIKADALEEVGNAATAGVGTVNDAGSTQVNAVNSAGTTQVGNVNAAGETQVAAVNQAGETQVAAVKAEGEKQTAVVEGAGSDALTAINTAGSTQVNAVNSAGTTQVGNVNAAGETQVAAVNQAGTTQVAAVKSEGETQVAAVKAEGEKQTAAAAAEAGKAEDSAEDAEAWAVGKRNGVDVPATDPTYQNNAKWISEHIYVTLGVDDTPSETSENPVMNKALVLGDENTKAWHLGLYIDSDGDLCQA